MGRWLNASVIIGLIAAAMLIAPKVGESHHNPSHTAGGGAGGSGGPRWKMITSGSIPSGTTSWNDALTGTANDYTVVYEIDQINSSFTLSVLFIESLGSDLAGNALTTTWKFSTDGNGTSATGVISDATNQAKGLDTFVSSTAFLSGDVTVTKVGSDKNVDLTITSRGRNPNNNGMSSDSTASPDEGTYTALLDLRALY
ncbi:MAG: hypothetical protein O3A46_03755 [Candidatus Poribacteria bacterium]|nr:hypothetical protein [Candidatus Poribacteria bacterium]